MIGGVTVLVVGAVEFEPLVIFSCDDSDLCFTFAAIIHRALENSDPFVSMRVEIFLPLLLPKAHIGVKLLVPRSLHQEALLHKFLHESVNFMIDLCGLEQGIRAGVPLQDFSVLEEWMVLSLLARRLIKLILNIGIRFTFGSFGIRTGMAGPVIATDFRRRAGIQQTPNCKLQPKLACQALSLHL